MVIKSPDSNKTLRASFLAAVKYMYQWPLTGSSIRYGSRQWLESRRPDMTLFAEPRLVVYQGSLGETGTHPGAASKTTGGPPRRAPPLPELRVLPTRALASSMPDSPLGRAHGSPVL